MRFAALVSDQEHVYFPIRIQGNHGDTLIWRGLCQLLRNNGVPVAGELDDGAPMYPRSVSGSWQFPEIPPEATTIVINGGGNVNDKWSVGLAVLLHALERSRPDQRIIVGPQSYWFDRTDFAAALTPYSGKQVILYARERPSYRLLRSLPLPEGVRVRLDHDLALRLDPRREIANPPSEEPYDLVCFRSDLEAAGPWRVEARNPRFADIAGQGTYRDYLATIAGAERIYTDRLHVAIAGHLLGKEVRLYPNNYHKVRGVWEYSLRGGTVRLVEGTTTKPEPKPASGADQSAGRRRLQPVIDMGIIHPARTAPARGVAEVGAPTYSECAGWEQAEVPIRFGSGYRQVTFRLSAGQLSRRADALLPLVLVPAMNRHLDVRIDGPVSPRLLTGLETIQDIFQTWFSGFRRATVSTPGTEPATPADGRGVALFFSGGVDSTHMLLKRFDEIDTLVFVHGFDIAIGNVMLRRKVAGALRRAAADFGKQLIEVETDIRCFSDPHAGWKYHYHGAALACVALLLEHAFRKVYITAATTYKYLLEMASHPCLDPHWSTEAVEIVHDGCEATRFEKIMVVCASDVALRTLRVCWENREGRYNCGDCGKCLRTMAALRAAGMLERCSTFDRPLDLAAVTRAAEDQTRARRTSWRQILALARHRNDRELVQAIQAARPASPPEENPP